MLVTQKFANSYYSVKRFLLICNVDTNKMPIFHRLYRCCSSQTDLKLNGFDSETVENITNKIIYNSVVTKGGFYIQKLRAIKKTRRANKQMSARINNTQIVPIALRQMLDSDTLRKLGQTHETEERESAKINLPYAVQDGEASYIVVTDDNKVEATCNNNNAFTSNDVQDLIVDRPAIGGKKWMCDYECFNDAELDDGIEEWQVNYGTHDANVPVSKTPCGGCGAILHCQNPSIPGYLPSELFKNCRDERSLRSITCQRCYFLRHYNMALSVSVEPDYYPRLLSKIKDERALVILLVDLTDFPCSIWPNLLNIIGKTRPLFLVGNKVDVLWGDSERWMETAKESLRAALPRSANVLHTALISAKTGFGVEELITNLQNVWQYKGDVYLIGCTNVGKSTLFNAMLQSDYCKVKAVDLVQRATTAPWPGTTLNLLKFPILRPEGWRLYLRTKRIVEGKYSYNSEGRLFREQFALNDKPEDMFKPHLMGHIGRTFYKKRDEREMKEFAMNVGHPKNINEALRLSPGSGLDPNDKDVALSRWLYDTPGVIQPDQIIDLLTHEELMMTLPRDLLRPRSFSIRPGQTIMIGGLSRIDYIEGDEAVRMTVFSPNCLPITVCELTDAEKVYQKLLGTKMMAVPTGESSRLAQWPGLSQGEPFTLMGCSKNRSCADVVLSNTGWVAVTPAAKVMCRLSGWTPGARGIHVRMPPLLPFAVNLRGKMIRKTTAYEPSRPYLS